MVSTSQLLFGLAAFAAPVFSQTFTNCNPMNKTCPADPALGIDYTFNLTSAPKEGVFNTTAGSIVYGTNGAEFTISEKGQSPTIQSNFYIFFGRVETHMKAASGTGIVSSVVLESDDLDEVDWEFIGGNNTTAETNYFGKGNTTLYDRAIWYPVADTNTTFHNYTTVWTAERLDWYIDGVLTRTLLQPDADDNGYDYPQTPMYLKIGIWAGGDPTENSNGTVEWAGGVTDYSDGPFTMYVSQVRVTDYSSGKEYEYGDKTGSWESIKVIAGNSTVADTLLATPAPTVSQKWDKTSSTVKIIVYAAAGAIAAVLVSTAAFCCLRRRRAGRLQHVAQEQRFESDRIAMQGFQTEYQRNLPTNPGYQGLGQQDLRSPIGTPHEMGYDNHLGSPTGVHEMGYENNGYESPRMAGYENDHHYDARSIDERPREGHGFIN